MQSCQSWWCKDVRHDPFKWGEHLSTGTVGGIFSSQHAQHPRTNFNVGCLRKGHFCLSMLSGIPMRLFSTLFLRSVVWRHSETKHKKTQFCRQLSESISQVNMETYRSSIESNILTLERVAVRPPHPQFQSWLRPVSQLAKYSPAKRRRRKTTEN